MSNKRNNQLTSNRPIPLEERKKIQLKMLVEIDDFCRRHKIHYILAFGTLLGAIRHKGYIPWDDDIDISMPYEDLLRFKKEFKSNELKYCDIETEKYYGFPFSRVCYLPTYSKSGLTCKTYGINIDIYPLIEVSNVDEVISMHLKTANKLLRRRLFVKQLRDTVIRHLPVKTILFYKHTSLAYRNFFINKMQDVGGGRYFFIAGKLELFHRHALDFNPFDELIEVDFEGHKFYGPARYDEYLTTRYGDYMQLPPEDQRHPYHGGLYYWKE